MAGRHWTLEEDTILREKYGISSTRTLSGELDRSPEAIRGRAYKTGLSFADSDSIMVILPESGWLDGSKGCLVTKLVFNEDGRRFTETLVWRPGTRRLHGQMQWGVPVHRVFTTSVNVIPGYSTKLNQKRRVYRHTKRKEAIDLLGGRCRKCGLDDIRLLTFNHLGGTGAQDRKIYTNTDMLIQAILRGERNKTHLEILCNNCQVLYEFEQGRREWLI